MKKTVSAKNCFINSTPSGDSLPHCYFNCALIDGCPLSTKINGTGRLIIVDGLQVWEASIEEK